MEDAEIRKLADLEHNHWWYAARRSLLADYVSGLEPGRALDVGAGAGGNTRVLNDLGWATSAVELSPVGAGIARERGVAVVRADARFLPFADAAFDLLVSMDLWEHVEDDRRVAQEARRVLRPGGRALIAVPCDMSMWSDHDVAVDHVRRYEREQLVSLMTFVGFELVRVEYWNVLLRWVAKWRRGRDSSTGSDLTPLPRVVNAGLRLVVTFERRLPLQALPGMTLVVRAKRP